MSYPNFDELRQQYQELLSQKKSALLNDEQFIAEVQKLTTQDADGAFWAIEPQSGEFMIYTEQGWVFQQPEQNSNAELKIKQTLIKNPGCRRALGILALTLPFISGLIWFVYSSLAPGSEGWDCLTPLIIIGVPLLLLAFQRPIDSLLKPIQNMRRMAPKLVLRGAALALPFVVGIVCSKTVGTEYQGLRLSLIICMLGAYVLLRDPEVQQ